jgi:hypothetical protein
MKIRVTKKQIMEGYKNIIVAGYCDLQWLLKYRDADFNTCGVYGWNADIYKIDNNTVIVTGYRPFGNVRKYGLAKKYDEKARKIALNYDTPWEKQAKKLDKLIEKFVKESIEQNEI